MAKEASIEIIRRCLNRCLHCSSSSSPVDTEIIELHVVSEVLEGLSRLGFETVSFSGGEPFLHPSLLDMVQTAHLYGMRVNIYTSGIISYEDQPSSISREQFEKLNERGLNAVMFNLQSMREETYDTFTATHGHFQLALASVRNALSAGTSCEVHFVPTKLNVDEVTSFIERCESEGIKQVSFLKLMPHGRALKNLSMLQLSDEEYEGLREHLAQICSNGSRIRIGIPLSQGENCARCHAVREKLYIRFDGAVFGCEAFKYLRFVDETGTAVQPDTIFDLPIEEIARGSCILACNESLVNESLRNDEFDEEACPVQRYLKARGSRVDVQNKR